MSDVRFNVTLPGNQHEWLRQRAFAERRNFSKKSSLRVLTP